MSLSGGFLYITSKIVLALPVVELERGPRTKEEEKTEKRWKEVKPPSLGRDFDMG
jgi:hypothetical protein